MQARTLTLGAVLALNALACRDDATLPTESSTLPPSAAGAALNLPSGWSTLAPMPTGRQNLAAAVVYDSRNRPRLYAIGGVRDGNSLTTVEEYDFASSSWSTKAPLPDGLGETNGAVAIAGKIYVSGGRNLGDVDGNYYRRALWVYDPATDAWSRKNDLPVYSQDGISGAINGKLYVLAGYPSLGSFFRYDPATDTWTSLPGAPSMHERGAGAVIRGKFYVAGGEKFTSTGTYAIAKLHEYDPATGRWVLKTPMLRASYLSGAARMYGKLFIIGGQATSRVLRRVQAYDPATDTWAWKRSAPTWNCCWAASNFVLDGSQGIILVGGAGSPEVAQTYVYVP